ncbi:two pore domain potassium channel family protein [Erythrobacter sp. 3-20A1M]|uniref:ion channel n=1 Tax=Erythrobacter sp. 3-20A1M TaxID=2653850 RepID=UPI001BFC42DF|nr:ion channel [Erythrobacter sp. 3-20A1M]QWC56356.1 two pore domain potassium channel family protein [Erythrobacter sp. 3-20A1M]
MTITMQLVIGAVMVGLTMVVQAGFVAAAFALDDRMIPSRFRKSRTGTTLLLASATIWMLLALSAAAWLWAGLFMTLGAFQELEPALYFATVSLTTLGFGDVILSPEVRLLSAIVAANGLIMFGLSTAFLLDFVGELRTEGRATASRTK